MKRWNVYPGTWKKGRASFFNEIKASSRTSSQTPSFAEHTIYLIVRFFFLFGHVFLIALSASLFPGCVVGSFPGLNLAVPEPWDDFVCDRLFEQRG